MAQFQNLTINGNLTINNGVYSIPYLENDFAYKEGPISWADVYKNNWNNGGSVGSSLNGTSYGTGIYVNSSGWYYVEAFQRPTDAAQRMLGISLNGDRPIIEGRTDSGWSHDHSTAANSFTYSYYIGYFEAGSLICAGGPDSAGFLYAAYGYAGGLIAWRLK